DGVVFHSDTDTEVIAQLIAHHFHGNLIEAVRKTLTLLKGTYGLAVISPQSPELLIGARQGSPLVLGIGQGEHFLASDSMALVDYTEKVVYLQDHQMCVLTADSWQIFDQHSSRVDACVHLIDWDAGDADKGDFENYMLKEIYEQPEALENAMRGRLSDNDASSHFGGLNLDSQQLRQAERLIWTGCGTCPASRARAWLRSCGLCRTPSAGRWLAMRRCNRSRSGISVSTMSSIWADNTSTRWPWKGPSSSRKSATSTPRAIPPPK